MNLLCYHGNIVYTRVHIYKYFPPNYILISDFWGPKPVKYAGFHTHKIRIGLAEELFYETNER